MARRVPGYGDGGGGLVLIAVGLAFYFAFPFIVAAVVYGAFIGIVVGLTVSEYRSRPRPSISSQKQLDAITAFSDDEILRPAISKGTTRRTISTEGGNILAGRPSELTSPAIGRPI